MVVKFADIAKGPKDLLNEDYASKVSLKCKKAAGPVSVSIESVRAPNGSISSKVGSSFSYAGLNFDKVQMEADGNNTLETSLVPCKGCKVSFKGNTGADLGIDYSTGSIMTSSKLDVKDLSKFSTSACVGLSGGVTLGADASFALTGKTGLSDYNVGASYSSGPLFASVVSANKASAVNLSLMYKVNSDLTLASSTTHSASKKCDVLAVGGMYNTSYGLLKAKVGSNNVVSASLIKEIAPKVTLTATGSMTGTDSSTFKYGLGLAM